LHVAFVHVHNDVLVGLPLNSVERCGERSINRVLFEADLAFERNRHVRV
jgi:hypothetical protein